MDNVTHALTGLILARCGLPRAGKYSGVLMILAANAPDIDAVSLFGGPMTYLEYHRGYTHSLAFAPLMALLPVLILRLAGVRFSLAGYLGSLAGVLSHLLLDLTGGYGVRLLLPFSAGWLRLDITDLVDFWILAMLLLALAAPALAGLVSSEVGSRKIEGPKRAWAWFAIIGLVVYDTGRFVSHERALAVLGSHVYGGEVPRRATALPAGFSPLRWRGIVEGEDFAYEVMVDLTRDFDPGAGVVAYVPGASPALDAARRTPPFQAFERFNQLPFWRLVPQPDGLEVELLDLRLGSLVRPGFVATALVEPGGKVRDAQLSLGGLPRR